MDGIVVGFALIIFAAVCGGAFATPIKFRHRFELENLYVIAAFITMIVVPFVLAPIFLPHWTMAISQAGSGVVWRGLAFGFAWGLGAITFGYSISMVGLSVGYAVIMGINTAVGSILPFIAQWQGSIFQPSSIYVVLGIAGCVVGVAICGVAGHMRAQNAVTTQSTGEAGLAAQESGAADKKMARGLMFCMISGVLSACANLGFAFTSEVGAAARHCYGSGGSNYGREPGETIWVMVQLTILFWR
jgi:L-rhamnose-H+ transport protein